MNKDGTREFGFACDLEVEDHRSGSMIVAVVLPNTENCFMVWIVLIAAAIILAAGHSICGTPRSMRTSLRNAQLLKRSFVIPALVSGAFLSNC